MKYSIILFTSIFITFQVFGNTTSDLEKVKSEIASFFSCLKNIKFDEVVPYSVNKKIGLMNLKTRQILIKPSDSLDYLSLAKPEITGRFLRHYSFSIAPDFTIRIEKIELRPPAPVPLPAYMKPDYDFVSSEKLKGFNVDDSGKVLQCSNEFHLIQEVFKLKGKNYAIAWKKLEDGWIKVGIIDEEGNTNPNFNFSHYSIKRIDDKLRKGKELWFTVSIQEFPSQYQFIDWHGNQNLNPQTFGNFDHAFFGLAVNHLTSQGNNGKSRMHGVLDIYNQEWVLNLQSELKFDYLDYSSKVNLNTMNPKSRKKAEIYVWVYDNARGIGYFMDLQGEKCLPNGLM